MKIIEWKPYSKCSLFSFFPDNWKDNPDVASYLTKLGSFGVQQLSK
jgi:hypothetical protein